MSEQNSLEELEKDLPKIVAATAETSVPSKKKNRNSSYKAIAKLPNISPYTVENHMHAAYNSIRQRLEHLPGAYLIGVMIYLFFE